MPITTGFNHVATLTSNMERLVGFYRDVFGAEVTFEMAATPDHPRMTILDLGAGTALNVFEATADEIIGERRKQGKRGAIDHYGLNVDSLATLEQVKERLLAAGASNTLRAVPPPRSRIVIRGCSGVASISKVISAPKTSR